MAYKKYYKSSIATPHIYYFTIEHEYINHVPILDIKVTTDQNGTKKQLILAVMFIFRLSMTWKLKKRNFEVKYVIERITYLSIGHLNGCLLSW